MPESEESGATFEDERLMFNADAYARCKAVAERLFDKSENTK
jgi:hypothetical protein